METNMRANGIERMQFYDALKAVLNNKMVCMNAFGHTIIMEGHAKRCVAHELARLTAEITRRCAHHGRARRLAPVADMRI